MSLQINYTKATIKNTTIQIRIDTLLKKRAQKILKGLGFDLSAAINLYLEQVIICGGIPFLLLTKQGHERAARLRKLEKNCNRVSSI